MKLAGVNFYVVDLCLLILILQIGPLKTLIFSSYFGQKWGGSSPVSLKAGHIVIHIYEDGMSWFLTFNEPGLEGGEDSSRVARLPLKSAPEDPRWCSLIIDII